MDWFQVISLVLGIGITLLGVKLANVKKAIAEIGDVPESISEALADDKLTAAELKGVLKEAKEALAAIKAVFKK